MRKAPWRSAVGSFLILLAIFVFLPAYAVQVQQDAKLGDALSNITEIELKENVRFISHRNFTGRGTLNDDYELTSLFLERELREYGFQPLTFGKEKSYFQNFTFKTNEIGTGIRSLKSRNVLGYIEGGAKKEEVVVIGAHYDHVGLGDFGSRGDERNPDGFSGKIHYGADDNASGTSAVLEIAESLGELNRKGVKPLRSVIVCFWGAEELGLIGSNYFVKNPPANLKLENIAAYINLDMVGRNEDKNLSAVGTLRGDDFPDKLPELHRVITEANKKLEQPFKIAYENPDMSFMRSDQWSFFTAKGSDKIPCVFFFTGEHPDYHRPSDTWEKINYPKLTRVTKLAFLTLWEASEMKEKPSYR